MALVALAQAVTTTWFGPRSPYWIESWPLAALPISLGMVKAETLSGPFVEQPLVLDLDRLQAADARAEDHAAAAGIFLGEVDARVARRRRCRRPWANCTKRSNRLTSLASM